MFCENCQQEHSGSYATGRFCSAKCARGFSTKYNREETNRKVSETLKLKIQTGKIAIGDILARQRLASEASQTYYDNLRKTRNFDDQCFATKRKIVIDEQQGECDECGLSKWIGKTIILEIDHCDGDNNNNTRNNLRGLCPNCHSLTETWRGRNKKNKLVSDDELITAIIKHKTIHAALKSVGMAAKGRNYDRCHRLMVNLEFLQKSIVPVLV
jgi:Zn finger protein HypA/HybF involved in hydrogenase expression